MKLDDLNIHDIGNKIGLVGAVFGDEHNTYLVMFPDHDIQENTEVLDMDVDDWTRFLRQTDLLETEVLTYADDGTISKAILRKTQRMIEARISWNVFRRDGYTCRYCGRNDVPLTVDHLVLWEENGPSIEANLVAACKKCNKTRGTTQYAAWLSSPYYSNKSLGLTEEVRRANDALVLTLDAIPRNTHQRSRGKKKR
jgi:hypothetical protein